MGELSEITPWIEGTLFSTVRTCGKKNCACRVEGPKHPVMYITGKQKGKGVDSEDIQRTERDHPSERGVMGINTCPECLKKQRRIDALEEQIVRLKSRLSG